MSIAKDNALELIDNSNSIVRRIFWPIIGSPFILGPILYAFANGYTQSENHVILYFFILLFYSAVFLVFFSMNNKLSDKIIKWYSKNKKGIAEKLSYDENPLTALNINKNRFSELEIELIIKHAKNIVKMKIIISISIFLSIATFLFIGLLL